jgi:hypothetical protein
MTIDDVKELEKERDEMLRDAGIIKNTGIEI